ncbi:MAG: 50S ribosomal protein L17 [bacterium]|nr:50S ribosomal protein L17 [bacterium]
MRHGKKGRKFGRKTGQRRAFLKSIAHNLILKEKIETTEARAKEIRPIVEKLVTLAKKQTLASLRLLLARLPRASAEKLYFEIAKRYADRNGGYLRIVKQMKRRKRDGTRVAIIVFV